MEKIRKPTLLLLVLFCCFLLFGVIKEVFFRQPLSAFEVSEKCPDLCWLDIQPGATRAEEVISFLSRTREIDKDSIQIFPHEIRATWTTKITNIHKAYIGFTLDNEIVTDMDFSSLFQVTVGDAIELFGEPDEIRFMLIVPPDSSEYILYMLYFSSPKIIIEADPIEHISGPNPNDSVLFITTNSSGNSIPKWIDEDYGPLQPWLGYGDLEKYLPEIP